jgi:DNA-binding LytR/AlgR family response regulator
LGLSINSIAEAVIILGLAPLNFLAMLAVHRAPLPPGTIRAAAIAALIALANTFYLLYWDVGGDGIVITAKVGLVTILTVAAVAVWNRQRTLEREVLELKKRPGGNNCDVIVLRGDNDKEILRLAPEALRYVRANGNYVDVHFLNAGAPGKAMLRATLAGIAAQAPQGTLIHSHRSYLVNLTAAQRIISRAGSMEIEFGDGVRIPVSRSFRSAVRGAANQ